MALTKTGTDGIKDDAVTLDKLAHGTSGQDGKFLRANNGAAPTYETVNTDLVSDTSPQLGGALDGNGNTADFTGNNTSLGLPRGSTAQQPSAGSTEGHIRYDNDDNVIYYSNGTDWIKIAAKIAILTSVTGDLYVGEASTLTLAGSGFMTANLVVNFVQSSDSINTNVTVTPTSDSAATVAVPAAVYNSVTAGNAVTIKVTNADSTTSGTVNKTALALPTGGTITNSGGYRIHTFNSSGTLTMTFSKAVQFLVIGGGGGVGTRRHSGGGGAGGYRSNVTGESSGANSGLESAMTLSAQSYTVTVGGGGASSTGGSNSNSGATQGGTSTFNGISSSGGGYGSCYNTNAQSGGCGGGSGSANNNRSGSAGSGTAGQGFGGGIGTPNASGGGGGGGGGAGVAGGNAGTSTNHDAQGGSGGNGISSSITGSSVTRAGGGGGGSDTSGSNSVAGLGGGGAGVCGNCGSPYSGTANTGGGAGGGGSDSRTNPNGGSGVVIVRYQL